MKLHQVTVAAPATFWRRLEAVAGGPRRAPSWVRRHVLDSWLRAGALPPHPHQIPGPLGSTPAQCTNINVAPRHLAALEACAQTTGWPRSRILRALIEADLPPEDAA